jgi:hypothetical protein
MVVFPFGIKLANVAAVQCLHDADPSEHRGAVLLHHQYQRFDRGLPFRLRGLLFWKRGDEGRRIAQSYQRPAVGQGNRFVEMALPAGSGISLAWPA